MNISKKTLSFTLLLSIIPTAYGISETTYMDAAKDYGRILALVVKLEGFCINDENTQKETHCDKSYGCIQCFRCAKGPIDHVHEHEYIQKRLMQPVYRYLNLHYSTEKSIADAFINEFIKTLEMHQGLSYDEVLTNYLTYKANQEKASYFMKKIHDKNAFP